MKAIILSSIVISLIIGAQSVYAISDFLSGFKYGLRDGRENCLTEHQCHWYVMQPGKGFINETKEFVKGYITGYCSIPGNTNTSATSGYAASDFDQASFDCSKGPDSASWLTDTEQEAGVASDAHGRPCTFGPHHDQCLKQFIQELNKPIDDWMAAVPKDNNTFNDTPGYGTRTLPTGDACYDAGLDDGKHGAFEPYTFGDYCGPTSTEHHTENRYYKGFIDGLGH